MNILFLIFQLITSASAAVIVFVGGTRYRSLPRPLKFLTFNFSINLLLSLTGILLSKLHIHSLFLLNIQIPIEYILFTMALSYWITHQHLRKIIQYSIPLFIVLSTVLFLTIEDFFAYSNISSPIFSTLLLVSALYVFLITLNDTSMPITSQSGFWISAGLIIFHGGNITFFLMLHAFHLISQDALSIAMIFHNLISTMAYIVFTMGFLCLLKTTKS